MKQYISGFKQKELVKLKLSVEHLEIFFYFKDFVGYKHMKSLEVGEDTYYWLSYQKVIDDLPILFVSSTRTIARRFDDLVEANFLDKHLEKNKSGTRTYFKIGETYYDLRYKEDIKVKEVEEETLTKKELKVRKELNERFKEFWKLYPRKNNRKATKVVYDKLSKELHETIVSDLEKRTVSEDWTKDNGKWIPNPGKYLEEKRWERPIVVGKENIFSKSYDDPSRYSGEVKESEKLSEEEILELNQKYKDLGF